MLSLPLTRRRLEAQGFTGLTDRQLAEVAPWLRFTPVMNMLVVGAATLMHSVPLFLTMATLMLMGAVFSRHPFDWVYNGFIRPLENSPELPRSRWCRRVTFAMGSVWLFGAAWLLKTDYAFFGILLGIVMTVMIAPLAAVHFCLPSEMIRLITARKAKR